MNEQISGDQNLLPICTANGVNGRPGRLEVCSKGCLFQYFGYLLLWSTSVEIIRYVAAKNTEKYNNVTKPHYYTKL
jgi:hypothetical protein